MEEKKLHEGQKPAAGKEPPGKEIAIQFYTLEKLKTTFNQRTCKGSDPRSG